MPFLSLSRLAVGGLKPGSVLGAGGLVQSVMPDLSQGAAAAVLAATRMNESEVRARITASPGASCRG